MEYKDLNNTTKRLVDNCEEIFIKSKANKTEFIIALAFLINKFKFKKLKGGLR